ncbi:unnamed protein product [Durusdinium trenchii]|uniref:Uncharacterized protein n=2 Tax=Durusdinium trenchii TaxID=1381693 RepID=A0ABP0KP58_9DINO
MSRVNCLWLAFLAFLPCVHLQPLANEVSLELVDWECRQVVGLFNWNKLREIVVEYADFESPLAMTEFTEAALVLQDPEARRTAFQECPIGAIFLASLNLGICLHRVMEEVTECEDVADFLMASMFRREIPLAVILTSSWPVRSPQKMVFLYERGSHNLSTFWHSLQHSPSLNCEDDEFFAGFLKDLNWAIGQGESLVGKLSKWLFAPKVQELEMDQLRQSNWEPPCRLGWIAIMILKASIGWHTEPRTFFTYAESLRPYLMLLSPWHFLGSSWFLSMLLPHVCQFHRTAFHLDFDQTELMAETHPSLASMLLGSPAMRQSAQAVLSHARPYVVRGEQRLLVYASYVWGEDYVRWLPAYVSRFHELGMHNLIMFCGDETAYEMCRRVEGSACVFLETKTGLHRYTIPLALMNMGVDAFVIDFDIYAFKNLTEKLIVELESYQETPEFLVGGSFGDACICNAFAYYRSTLAVRDFTRTLLAWLYQYPFPHGVTQKALSAFLGEEPMQKTTGSEPWVVKEEILVKQLPPVPRLKWSLLEPGVEFSSSRKLATSGWAGRQEDIVVYHFFHGGWLASESAVDANEPWDEFDIFYNLTCEDTVEACAARREARIRRLLEKSRLGDRRPPTNISCETLEVIDFTVTPSDEKGMDFTVTANSPSSENL